MKRLGILENSKQKRDFEKQRVQNLLGEFFKTDKNAKKFSDKEKEAFIKNFTESFINGGKLKPLPEAPKPK